MSAKKYSLLSCFSVFLFLALSDAQAADFFVAPGGNDAKPGSPEQPFATPARALEKARGVKDEPVTIHLRDGVYELDEPLRFTPEDARTEKAPLTIRVYHNERPILSAGVKLSGWQVGFETWDYTKAGRLTPRSLTKDMPSVPATYE